MASSTDPCQIAAERLIAGTIGATWLLWLVGGLYIAGPSLGWVLAMIAGWKLFAAPALPAAQRPLQLGALIWSLLIGMAAMEVILLTGHATNGFGFGQTIKSSIGWAKGWALIALFPFAAAVLNVRAEVIYRAVCKLGRQTLVVLPIFVIAPYAGLPEMLWVSPLQIFGGSGPEYFATILYTIEPGAGTPRWQFFAPWSPAAGMVAVIHALCAAEEKNIRWKLVGIAAALLMAILSQSRLALVALVLIWPVSFAISRLGKSWIWWLGAPAILALGLLAPILVEIADQLVSDFSSARADSSRVRAALGRIAMERWQNEAPWFGHGIVESGPHLVEYMPIGSHHSWYGLLFVKGVTGLLALAIPLLIAALVMAKLAISHPLGRIGLSMVLVLVFYSFGENLEILAYLYWPGLALLGVAARQSVAANLH
ncbi:O-antigen ligase family protein [Aurantiacibacter marinus]|uniref:Capsular biosynthesis protein n=1 Tax=Aurantiacibacter marinus TaxID=874156 RepID=A0A0H0XR11_9SPHN|nr:O-antigen ligase family protein [Aurantiacibacter marinus]KLI64357.1 capsular biosynthesis protein [Aurantiacibacter marinus]